MENKQGPLYLGGFSLALLVCAIIGGLMDHLANQSVQDHITTLQGSANTTAGRITAAQTKYDQRHGQFADHWSDGLQESLSAANKTLGKNGQVFDLLTKAQKALDSGDRALANVDATSAETLLTQSTDVVNKILGPPDGSSLGLYEQLDAWAKQADTQITSAEDTIKSTQKTLDGKKEEVWNKPHGLMFPSAYGKLFDAQKKLDDARSVLNSDKPQAYEDAVAAVSLCTDAITASTADEKAAKSAQDAIDAAQTRITSARSYINSSSYNSYNAGIALDGAESTLTLARQSFTSQDFATALKKANEALTQANSAESMSYTPTPTATPSPTPTPRPPSSDITIININNNNGGSNDGGSSPSYGGSTSSDSSDNSWTSPSTSNSDDNSWDTGGSSSSSDDSWTSSSSDDNSWDSGSSSDDSSWTDDSGGSDDSSWKSIPIHR